jgi:predicted Zn-dependent protease
LCDFRAREYRTALNHLRRGMALGLAGSAEMQSVSRYHQVLALNMLEEHETAWPVLTALARGVDESPQLIEAAGLNALRMAVLPADIPHQRRDLVLSTGRAMWLALRRMPAEAQHAFEALVRAYSAEPNVHYAYASFLLPEQPDNGIRELERELELSPEHVPALVSLAFEYLKRKDATAALPYARRAAAAAPNNFAARSALGRVLIEAGEFPAGATELEAAARLAPDSPQVRFALAGTYRRLGRAQEAEREQREFLRLKKLSGDAP